MGGSFLIGQFHWLHVVEMFGLVFVISLAGMSRSVTVAVAYIMSVTNLRCHEALLAVRGARSLATPNKGFQRQLQEFESNKLPAVN